MNAGAVMYELDSATFNKEEFLREYWQKKPVVIRQAFKHFVAPIEADEVAGLAGIEQVQSRLVYREGEKWQAQFGPFESFEHLGDKNWSLIVQALDNWSEESAELVEPFRFIPNWRLDDLMVSFATPGGGVGPHIDWYDVFICQGTGVRNWRVGDKGDHVEYAAHDALLHCEPFEPIIDTKVYPGDILYIPPGFPHDGVTLENSLSFSVGFRTNSTSSLVSGLADFLLDEELGTEQIVDPDRAHSQNSGAITDEDFELIKQQFQQLIDNKEIMQKFAGVFLSEPKHELDIVETEGDFDDKEISTLLHTNNLVRLGGLKAFYFDSTVDSGIFYLKGEEVNFEPELASIVKSMCDNVIVTPEMLGSYKENKAFNAFLAKLLDAGLWYFAESEY